MEEDYNHLPHGALVAICVANARLARVMLDRLASEEVLLGVDPGDEDL